MKSKKTALFAGAVALLVAYAVYDFQIEKTEQKQKEEGSRLVAMTAEQIQKISWKTPEQSFDLERVPQGWKFVQPLTEFANSATIANFLEELTAEKDLGTATEGDTIDPQEFGLDPALGEIGLSDNLGEKIELKVGSIKNFEGNSFIQKNRENIIRISGPNWFQRMKKSMLDFRDKRLMRKSNASTVQIQIQTKKDGLLELLRQEQDKVDKWVMTSAKKDWDREIDLDQNKVRELLFQLNNVEALDFIAEGNINESDLKKWNFGSPDVALKLQDRENKTFELKLAVGTDKVYRVWISEPLQVLRIAPTEAGSLLNLNRESLLNHARPFLFDRNIVDEVIVQMAGAPEWTLNRQGDAWTSAQGEVDAEKARALLVKVGEIKASTYGPFKNSKWDHRMILKDKDGKEVWRLEWSAAKFAPGDSQIFAKSSALGGNVFLVEQMDLDSLKLLEILKKKEEGL